MNWHANNWLALAPFCPCLAGTGGQKGPVMLQRILIAEDDELQGSLLQSILKQRGHQAELVTNGFDAVRRLRTGEFDLGLLDYRMPEVSGLAAARLLHDILPRADCPRLIAVTAAAEELHQQKHTSETRWFDAVVSKQIGLPGLIAAIDASLAGIARDRAAALDRRLPSARPPSLPAAAFHDVRLIPPTRMSWSRNIDPEIANAANSVVMPAGSDGHVQTISLAAFKSAMGSEWPRVALRAMLKAEGVIQRRLGAKDVVSRRGDHGFIVWFETADSRRNEMTMFAVSKDIRAFLLTDFSVSPTRMV